MNHKITDRVWSENAKTFMNVKHTSQLRILHPEIIRQVEKIRPRTVFDYGCGDGRLLKEIDSTINIDVYDLNEEMLELTKFNLGNRIDKYFRNIASVESNSYDCVICSMVLVCIQTEKEYGKIISQIKRVKKEDGKVIFAVSHPCFREEEFSNFHTSYSKDKPNTYLKEGKAFDVFIEDDTPPSVAFVDYHWSLSFTLNKILESGMKITEVIETKDDFSNSKANKYSSPFLLITAI